MLTYEFYYNWEYARKHNPSLLGFGTSGGFGCQRAQMMKAVKGGDQVRAERLFWQLIKQSLIETKHEDEVIGIGSFDELLEEWFSYFQRPDMLEHESYFVRLGEEGSAFQTLYQAYVGTTQWEAPTEQ